MTTEVKAAVERGRQIAAKLIDQEAFATLRRQMEDFRPGREHDPWSVFFECANRGIVRYPPPTAMERVMAAYDAADAIMAIGAAPVLDRATKAEAERDAMREGLKVAQAYALPTLNGIIESNVNAEIIATAQADKDLIAALVNGEGGE